MSVTFRNVEVVATDNVDALPYEALVTVIDRGLVPDWKPIFAAMRASPWGRVARRVEHYLEYREHDGASTLFRLALERARSDAEEAERRQVAQRVRAAIRASSLTAEEFARLVGTSASRLSTYATGRVVPSAAMLIRIEAAAGRGSQSIP
jgi:DNA-binding transcriptional regulator YiaG